MSFKRTSEPFNNYTCDLVAKRTQAKRENLGNYSRINLGSFSRASVKNSGSANASIDSTVRSCNGRRRSIPVLCNYIVYVRELIRSTNLNSIYSWWKIGNMSLYPIAYTS